MPRLTARVLLCALLCCAMIPLSAAEMSALILQARSYNAQQRLEAVKALGEIHNPKVVPVLVTALNDPVAEVAQAAVASLGKTADVEAMKALLPLAQNAQSPLRGNAVKALGILFGDLRDSKEAVAALLPLFLTLTASDQEALVQPSEKILRQLFTQRPVSQPLMDATLASLRATTTPVQTRAKLAELCRYSMSPRAVPVLLGLLPDAQLRGNAEAAIIAIMRAYRWTAGALLDPLRAMLAGKDPALRQSAARIFGGLADEQAVDPLQHLLHDADPETRAEAANALLQIGESRSLPMISALTGDVASRTRLAAATAARLTGDEQRLLPLVTDPAVDVREEVTRALIDYPDDAAQQALLTLAQDRDLLVRPEAWNALAGARGQRVVDAALAALRDTDSRVRSAAMRVLGMAGDQRAVADLVPLLQDKRGLTAKNAAATLAMLGDPRGISALNPPDDEIAVGNDRIYCRGMIYARSPQAIDTLVADIRRVLAKGDKENSYSDANGYIQCLAAMGTSVITRLNALLADPQPETRFCAAYICFMLCDGRTVPALLPLLNDQDQRVRFMALSALARCRDARALPALQQALPRLSAEERECLFNALGKFNDPRILPLCLAALHDPSADVREQAALAMACLYDPQTVPALLLLLTDTDSRVRFAAAFALEIIGSDNATDGLLGALDDQRIEVRSAALMALAGIGTPRAINGLLNALPRIHPDDWFIDYAALAAVKDPAVLPALLAAAGEEQDPTLRALVISALGNYPWERVSSTVQSALVSPDARVRCAAVTALGKVNPATALPLLRAALKDQEAKVRTGAVTALGNLADPEVVPLLCDVVLSADTPEVRMEAIRALGESHDPRALTPLLVASSDASFQVQNCSIRALGRLHDPRAIATLIQMVVDGSVRFNILQALVEIRDANASAHLLPSLTKMPSLMELELIQALGGKSDVAMCAPVVRALQGDNLAGRAAAAEALGRIPSPHAVPALIAALDDGSYPNKGGIRFADNYGMPNIVCTTRGKAAWALGEIGRPEAVAPLITALGWGTMDDREQVAMALGKLKDPSAVAPLIDALDQLTGPAHTAALTALRQLTGQDRGDDAVRWRTWWAQQAK